MSAAQPMPQPRRRSAPSPATPARRPSLSVVPAPVRDRGSSALVLVCIALLVGGLLGSLMLNTMMAKGSYDQARLQSDLAAQAQLEDSLQTKLDSQTSPRNLAARASALGMVQQQAPLIIRLSDGTVIGLDD